MPPNLGLFVLHKVLVVRMAPLEIPYAAHPFLRRFNANVMVLDTFLRSFTFPIRKH
jgi:hypothetical protein